MKVDVLRSTNNPERLVCQCARGDYWDGYVGEDTYEEIMAPVSFDEDDAKEIYDKQNMAETINKAHSSVIKEQLSQGYLGDDAYKEIMTPVSYDENDAKEIYEEEDMSGTINETHPAVIEAKTKSFIEEQLSRGHFGPWEHPQITFAVKGVSRVAMAQITRHRHLTFDVQSQRYVDFSETEAIVPATLLSDKERHKQYPHIYDENGEHFNRDEGHFDMSEEKRADWRSMYQAYTSKQLEFYEEMVAAGIPKEDARFVLPLGTPVNMTVSGNARTFMHLLDMRKKQNAQWEIRELSEQIIEELLEWMPYTYTRYEKYAPHKLSP